MSRSLRRQILYSALFWSVGLFLGVGLLAAVLLIQHPVQHVAVYGTVRTHWHVLWVPVIVLLAAGLLQLRRALSPLDPLRMRLGAVRARTAVRIEGQYPSEIQPLVDDLNALLEHQEQAVRRAIAKAGDLAHGLKTPLAVLAHEAERARAAGHTELADRIVEQIDRMRRQLDYHLAHARAAASGAAGATASNVAEAVEALVRTMARIHAARPIAFDVSVGAAHVVRVQREDLDEMLGNLLDNACKWTRSTVRVSSETDGGDVLVVVEDDGPGVAAELREAILQRGVRADQAAPGWGFGLAITRELAEVYGGAIELGEARGGGLRVRLRLPAWERVGTPPRP